MKYASEDLIHEHDGILFGLNILERMIVKLKQNEEVELDHLKEIINFFGTFADKCHHGKEEGLLFPVMEKYGIPNQNGPIAQMLNEHIEGRNHIANMKVSIKENFDKEQFIQAATGYVNLLRSHIEKENSILFPLGDKKIPEEEQKKLLEGFVTFEKDVMGEGVHESLHELLHNFEKIYLREES
jgi:hemerythrin-like domain-containing protein